MSHTPGPWTRQGRFIHHLQYEEPLDARNIIATLPLPNDNPETVHNGHLIAAAPDLLRAAKLALNVLAIQYDRGKGIVDARNALHAFGTLHDAIRKTEQGQP